MSLEQFSTVSDEVDNDKIMNYSQESNQQFDYNFQQQFQKKSLNYQQEALHIIRQIQSKNKNIFEIIPFSVKKQTSNKELSIYNRREKSLEELSKRFLLIFLDKEESMISLDKITQQLGVERRRIYDIINILESLKLVNRRGKNNYKWNGFKKIYQTISEYLESYNPIELLDLTDLQTSQHYRSHKREKSLEMLSIGFLKLFLHWKHVMTLEEAARKLSYKSIDDHKIKTKIRRLYDIANVFKSLGLIKKTTLSDTKKPAFEWVGEEGLTNFTDKFKYENKNEIIIKQETPQTKECPYQDLLNKYRVHPTIEDSVLNSMYNQMIVLNQYFQNYTMQNRLNQEQKTQNVFASVAANFLYKKDHEQTAKKIQKQEDLVITPQIKKTLTIIKPQDDESARRDESTRRKLSSQLEEKIILGDKTNTVVKRSSQFNLDSSMQSNFKKIKSIQQENLQPAKEDPISFDKLIQKASFQGDWIIN